METIGTVAAIIVGAVFVAAGALKLASGPGWTTQAVDLRVPGHVARVVPFVEIVVGAMLVVQLAEPWPAVAAIVLLIGFTAVIALRLADGSRPPCACFGSRSSRPLGAHHVVRNATLIALAVLAAGWA